MSIRHKHSHIYNISMCMCECVFVCCCLRAYKFIAKTFDAAERTFHIKTSSFCPAASTQVGRARASAVAACMFVCVSVHVYVRVLRLCAWWRLARIRLAGTHTHTHTQPHAALQNPPVPIPSGRNICTTCIRAHTRLHLIVFLLRSGCQCGRSLAQCKYCMQMRVCAAKCLSAKTGRGVGVATHTHTHHPTGPSPTKVKPEHILLRRLRRCLCLHCRIATETSSLFHNRH